MENFKEISFEEMKMVSGGNPFIIGMLGSLVAAYIWDTVNDWEGAKKMYNDGYNATKDFWQ
ncbi:MAG: hypothetical protein IPI77_16715 [Saprospiraceae bacterium]|nr:hypothetical protein [Saprospiraceae bacterium]